MSSDRPPTADTVTYKHLNPADGYEGNASLIQSEVKVTDFCVIQLIGSVFF